jgi:hypothetical protein
VWVEFGGSNKLIGAPGMPPPKFTEASRLTMIRGELRPEGYAGHSGGAKGSFKLLSCRKMRAITTTPATARML